MNEQQFTNTVIDLARLYCWHVTHFRPAQLKTGRWVTPLQGHPGFPDLVLVHEGLGGGVIFAELKVGRNKPSDQQLIWLDRLQGAQAETHVWYPADLPAISTRLARKTPT